MKAIRARAVLAAVLLLTAAPAATHGGGLRVLGICSNRFDYTFSAVLDGRGGPPRMVFTDLYGGVTVAAVGEAVGRYALVDVAVQTQRVFSAAVNAHLTRWSGTAVLDELDGHRVVLDFGSPLPRPGLMALLADTRSGARRYVREGDLLPLGATVAEVSTIDDGRVEVTPRGGAAVAVPSASTEERGHLARVWRGDVPAPGPVAARPAAPRRRVAQLTFNPLESSELVGWQNYPVTVVGPYGPNGANEPRVVNGIRMPVFRTASFSGSVMVYTR